KTLIGTTDTDAATGEDLTVLPAEVDYLLEAHNSYFQAPLGPEDVLGSFAGLRPLIRSRPGEPSSLTGEFRLFLSPGGLLSVAGGKYTTYRRMAEIITDEVVRRLRRHRSCRTHDYPLAGAPWEPLEDFIASETAALGRRHGLAPPAARH